MTTFGLSYHSFSCSFRLVFVLFCFVGLFVFFVVGGVFIFGSFFPIFVKHVYPANSKIIIITQH